MAKAGLLLVGEYPQWLLDSLETQFELHKLYEAEDEDSFIKNCADSIKAIGTRGDLSATRELIDQLPNLGIIGVYGVGFDGVDVAAATERSIKVTNTPDVLTKDVADLAVAMMLAQSRGVVGADNWARSGSWASKGPYALQRRAHGRKAGILGLGRIGLEVGKRLAAFDMDIAYYATTEKQLEQNWRYCSSAVELAEHSDYLFVTLAANPSTTKLVDEKVIEAIGKDGTLINVSRGSTVDEAALLSALSSGKLGYAALDVFNNEPAIDSAFFALDNVLLQPHHASATHETRQAMGDLVQDNLFAYLAGKSLITPVN